MAFGWSASDIALLLHLALTTVNNARKACGEYDELTREVSALHVVLRRLQKESNGSKGILNRPGDAFKEELISIASGCRYVLDRLDKILEKYNGLDSKEKRAKRLWQKVRFGNGQMVDLSDLRGKIVYYTSALGLFINMATMSSLGRVEKQMDNAGGDLKDIKLAVNGITAHLMSSTTKEGSILTAYAEDDTAVWREFRRELVKDGFPSSVIKKHKKTIQAYVKELGSRGLLDDAESTTDESDPGSNRSPEENKSRQDVFSFDASAKRVAREDIKRHDHSTGAAHQSTGPQKRYPREAADTSKTKPTDIICMREIVTESMLENATSSTISQDWSDYVGGTSNDLAALEKAYFTRSPNAMIMNPIKRRRYWIDHFQKWAKGLRIAELEAHLGRDSTPFHDYENCLNLRGLNFRLRLVSSCLSEVARTAIPRPWHAPTMRRSLQSLFALTFLFGAMVQDDSMTRTGSGHSIHTQEPLQSCILHFENLAKILIDRLRLHRRFLSWGNVLRSKFSEGVSWWNSEFVCIYLRALFHSVHHLVYHKTLRESQYPNTYLESSSLLGSIELTQRPVFRTGCYELIWILVDISNTTQTGIIPTVLRIRNAQRQSRRHTLFSASKGPSNSCTFMNCTQQI